MIALDEHRQRLIVELIEQSAEIDILVVKSRTAPTEINLAHHQDLEVLRAKQRETTAKLHAMEAPGINAWENIGDGG